MIANAQEDVYFFVGTGRLEASSFTEISRQPAMHVASVDLPDHAGAAHDQSRREHADAAIAAAVKAFGTTRRLPAFERQRVLRRIADGIHGRRDEFARMIALEAGKPIKSARMEVERAVFTFNIAAEETVRGLTTAKVFSDAELRAIGRGNAERLLPRVTAWSISN